MGRTAALVVTLERRDLAVRFVCWSAAASEAEHDVRRTHRNVGAT